MAATPAVTDADLPAAAAAASADDGEIALWQRLRAHDDAQARDALLALHLPYARIVAAAYYRKRFHDEIEFGEYHQFASLGLLEAMERYEPGRGAQFRTFAARRMHGAILDGIGRLTEKQQQIAARQRARAGQLQASKDLAASRTGLASATPPRHPQQLMHYLAEVGVGLALQWMLEGTAMVEGPEPAETVPFYRSAQIRQRRERLLQVVATLPHQEQAVIRGHYLQDKALDEVAAMLQVTRGRISQIHRQALARLRDAVADPAALDLTF
ncbi:MAG: sigma-70 family RNA polymerase sigma factor [Comamonadaceae bacterium]|nr:MAG: sigma-70 family RNA polymerase sigma factor [Comamonadaceae bacterium]